MENRLIKVAQNMLVLIWDLNDEYIRGVLMDNWVSLSNELYRLVWDKFYEHFNFKPSVHSSDWLSFSLPSPYITYKLTSYTDDDIDDLERKCVACLKLVTEPDDYLYALDWQHESFQYNPLLGPPSTISFYSDGDYYLFINKDFKWGYLGHPWEQTISIFGGVLIQQFEINKPKLFGEVVRSSE